MICVTCPCGQALRLHDELAGKKVRCPRCAAVLALPYVEAILLGGSLPYGAKAARSPDDGGFTHKPRSRRSRDDDDDDGDDVARKKKPFNTTPPAVSGKATAALTLGLLTCCVPGLFTLLAMIFGIIALVEINNEEKNVTGTGRAITGMVASVLGNVIAGVFWVLMFTVVLPSIAFLGCLGAVGLGVAQMKKETTENMRRIGAGAHGHHDATKQLPAPSTKGGLSWRVSILPYIEQKALADQIDMTGPWDSPKNRFFHHQRPKEFESKLNALGNIEPHVRTSFQTTVGPNGFFRSKDETLKMTQITDGTSNTIYVIDVPGNFVNWMQPVDLAIQNDRPLPQGLAVPQNFLVLMADGSVRTVARPKVNDDVLRKLIDRSDGQGDANQLD